MADPARVIMVTPDELEQLVRKAVRAELANTNAAPPDTKLLTSAEAADYCKMSKRAFLHHIKQDRLVPDSPARPGFSTHRFRRSTLDAFMVAVK